MNTHDFDTPRERRGTNSIKWSDGEFEGRWRFSPAPPDTLPQDAGVIPMWLADMDFTTAPAVIAAMQERVGHGIFGYTDFGPGFYGAISEWAAARHGWRPEREWIITNSGVMPAMSLLIRALSSPGEGVIVQSPAFKPIPEAVTLNGRRLVSSPLLMEDGRYQMNLSELEGLAQDPTTTLMVLCHPHNPVGRVWNGDELRAVMDICAANDVTVISDEIHGDLTYPWATFSSVGSLAAEYGNRVIVLTGPSKAFNLPGLKLSLTIVPDSDMRHAYLKTLQAQNEAWAAPILSATALEAAYTAGAVWLADLLDYLAANMRRVDKFLTDRLPRARLVPPDALYLAWIDCRQLGHSGVELDAKLRAAGLWVEQGATYGDEGEGFIRMTIACPRVVLDEALRRLERALTDGP